MYHNSRSTFLQKASIALCTLFIVFSAITGCKKTGDSASSASGKDSSAKFNSPADHGKYLVTVSGCNDCHTPMKMGAQGPEPDFSKMLSGHPADMKMPPPPKPDGPWMIMADWTLTAWSTPMGLTYSANITPDSATGLGKWDEATFMLALRNGKHIGTGRPIMPPMPWQDFKQMTDEDLKAIYAYLRTVPAVHNQVPDAVMAPPMGDMKK